LFYIYRNPFITCGEICDILTIRFPYLFQHITKEDKILLKSILSLLLTDAAIKEKFDSYSCPAISELIARVENLDDNYIEAYDNLPSNESGTFIENLTSRFLRTGLSNQESESLIEESFKILNGFHSYVNLQEQIYKESALDKFRKQREKITNKHNNFSKDRQDDQKRSRFDTDDEDVDNDDDGDGRTQSARRTVNKISGNIKEKFSQLIKAIKTPSEREDLVRNVRKAFRLSISAIGTGAVGGAIGGVAIGGPFGAVLGAAIGGLGGAAAEYHNQGKQRDLSSQLIAELNNEIELLDERISDADNSQMRSDLSKLRGKIEHEIKNIKKHSL
jgi:uncharacterized membrane protein